MEQLQKKVIETYTKNIEYLEKSHKELHKRVSGLSMLINEGEYTPRYEIEYIPEDKEFDIYDTVAETFLYDKKPLKFNKQAVRDMNLDKINSIDMMVHEKYCNKSKYTYVEDLDMYVKAEIRVLNDIHEYTKVFKTNTAYPKKQFKTIQKITFVGTLLGTHIPLIDKKLKGLFYFICEDNLEIFRLSLFTTDYSAIANHAKIYFSIMEDESLFKARYNHFLFTKFNENYMIKYYSSNYNISNYFDRIVATIYQFSPFKYDYGVVLYGKYNHTFQNMKEYNTLTNKSRYDILTNKQVLMIAAGPSFGENIDWIKENKDYFFIIAIGATVIKLIENDIIPNLITSLDSGEHTIAHFPDSIKDVIKDIPFYTSSMTHSSVMNQFNPKNTFLFETAINIFDSKYVMSGFSVGEVTLSIAMVLGANNIYLIGTDLAYHQETGASHDKDYDFQATKIDVSESKEDNAFFKDGKYSIRDNNITVKGNFHNEVVTSTIFLLSVNSYVGKIYEFKKDYDDIKIYNLNKHGAFIEGTIPTNIENLTNYDKTKVDIDILDFFRKNSTKELSKEHKESILDSFKEIDRLEELLNKLKKEKSKNYNTFLIARNDIFNIILHDMIPYNKFYLSSLLKSYLLITEPYILYCLNDKELKNEANIIKKVKKIWIEQIEYLCIDYKNYFNQLV